MQPALALVVAMAFSAVAPSPSLSDRGDGYPADISPPPGTQYPCALTALPRELAGVPAADRRYLNHTYAAILRATQAKLVLQQALAGGRDPRAAFTAYRIDAWRALGAIRGEQVPPGLEGFRDDVLAAIELQVDFFRQLAVAHAERPDAAGSPVPWPAQARQASQRLLAAWAKMQRRYPSWSAEVKDSVYHHLCALDLF